MYNEEIWRLFLGACCYVILSTLFLVQPSVAQELFKFREGSLALTINEGNGGALGRVLELVGSAPSNSKVEVFQVTDPDRIVIDVTGVGLRRSKEFAVTKFGLKAVRVGVHPGKARLVLDLKLPVGTVAPVLKWRRSGNMFSGIVGFGTSDRVVSEPKRLEATKKDDREHVAEPTEEVAKVALLKAKRNQGSVKQLEISTEGKLLESNLANSNLTLSNPSSEVKIQQPTNGGSKSVESVKPSPAPSTPIPMRASVSQKSALPDVKVHNDSSLKNAALAPAPVMKSLRLNNLKFNYIGYEKRPVIVFEMSMPGEYRLVEASPNKYVVQFPKAGLGGEYLGLPYFPPHDFVGVNMVQVASSASGLTAEILVDTGIKLSAYRKGKAVLVKTLNR